MDEEIEKKKFKYFIKCRCQTSQVITTTVVYATSEDEALKIANKSKGLVVSIEKANAKRRKETDE